MKTFQEIYNELTGKGVAFHGTLPSEEFGAVEHTTETERVYRTLTAIEQLQFKLRTAAPDERLWIQDSIAALDASIADYGY